MKPTSYSSNNSPSPPDSGRIRCVCEYDEDDGFTIQCEQCLVWQHAKCVGISKSSVPEQYFCEECNPVWHDDIHNMALQSIDIDSITTSTNHNHLCSLPSNNNNSNINIFGGPSPVFSNNNNNSNNSNNNIHLRNGFKKDENLNVNIIESFAAPARKKINVPYGVPAINEIEENIISHEAQPILDSFLSGLNVDRLERQQKSKGNSCNFEFQSTIVFDSSDRMLQLQKNLEVREIRARGYQKKGTSTKYGLFVQETCDPGHFIGEFVGHVQIKNLLTVKGVKEFPVTVSQSFVLYPLASVDLAIDARKFGNCLRYARRSCRPNVQIKPIIVLNSSEVGTKNFKLSWGLFSTNIIKSNSEILLPLDYHCGNRLFRYECACNAPDFCLGPIENSFLSVKEMKEIKISREVHNSSVGPVSSSSSAPPRPNSPKPQVSTNESAELEALGIRRSSSVVLQDATQISTSKDTRPILDTRKLTREERKLQKYIEYFEKMDSADAAKRTTTSASSSAASLGASRKGSTSGGSSPGPQHPTTSSSHTSSPGKSTTAGPKKAWKTLFSGDTLKEDKIKIEEVINEREEEREDMDASNKIFNDFDSSLKHVTMPVVKAKRGRKPGTKNQISQSQQQQSQTNEELSKTSSSSPLANKTTTTQSPSKIQTSPKPVIKASLKRGNRKDLSIVDEGDEGKEIDVGSEIDDEDNESESGMIVKKRSKKEFTVVGKEKEKETKKRKISKTQANKISTEINEDAETSNIEPLIVDIERSSSVINVVENNAHPLELSHNNNNNSSNSNSNYNAQSAAVQPDTPSKKKLSLSDYLKKKKGTSPAGGVISTLSFDELTETTQDADRIDKIYETANTSMEHEMEMGEISTNREVNMPSFNYQNIPADLSLRDAIFGTDSSRSSSALSRSSEIESDQERFGWSRVRHSEFEKDAGRYGREKETERNLEDRDNYYCYSNSGRDNRDHQQKSLRGSEYNKDSFRDLNLREQRESSFRDREQHPIREYQSRDSFSYPTEYSNEELAHKESITTTTSSSYREQLRELYTEQPSHNGEEERELGEYLDPGAIGQVQRAQMLQPTTSRFRDDREREMDRLRREKEFERREAEREKERREREKSLTSTYNTSMSGTGFTGKERERDGTNYFHRSGSSDYINYRPASTSTSTSGHQYQHNYYPARPRPSNQYSHSHSHSNSHPQHHNQTYPHESSHPFRERDREREREREIHSSKPPQLHSGPYTRPPYHNNNPAARHVNSSHEQDHPHPPEYPHTHSQQPRPPHQRPPPYYRPPYYPRH